MAQPEELQRALTTIRTAAMAANPGNKAHVDMVMAAAGEMCKGPTMSSTQVRKSGGGFQYRLGMLLEGLLLARLLKDASDLPAAMVRSINFLLGPSTAEVCRKAIAERHCYPIGIDVKQSSPAHRHSPLSASFFSCAQQSRFSSFPQNMWPH